MSSKLHIKSELTDTSNLRRNSEQLQIFSKLHIVSGLDTYDLKEQITSFGKKLNHISDLVKGTVKISKLLWVSRKLHSLSVLSNCKLTSHIK